MMNSDLKPIEECLYLTDIANSDCITIMDTLNVQGDKLVNIKNKNAQTNDILLRTKNLTKHIIKRRRFVGFVLVILLIILMSVWGFHKI